MINWTIAEADKSQPLIMHLCRKFPLAKTAYLRQLIRSGKVRINGLTVSGDPVAHPGDTIDMPESRKLAELAARCAALPEILFETDRFLIVRKPAGLATHAGLGHADDNLTVRVCNLLIGRGEKFRTAPIHRLDLPTSGPVIFGKGQQAISELGKLMQESPVTKKYLALILGEFPATGELVSDVPGKGKLKQARTRFTRIEQRGELTLLELQLDTGRQHQIRRQLADAGHPVAGDRRYRGPQIGGVDRLFLHCHFLGFTCPFSGRQVTVEDPLPDALGDVLAGSGFTLPPRLTGTGKFP